MFNRKPTELASQRGRVDPFALLNRLAPEFGQFFGEIGWPAFRPGPFSGSPVWSPNLDVFEKDNRLVARVGSSRAPRSGPSHNR